MFVGILKKAIRKIKEKVHNFLVNKVDFFLIKYSYKINKMFYRLFMSKSYFNLFIS